jgi:hypothetical protein
MRMLKNYKDFLFEEGLDLDLGGLGGDKKKEAPPDPEKEIAKEKAKKRKAAQKERGEQLDSAEKELKKILPKTPQDFRDKFEKRIMKAVEEDDRVEYHDLVLDIQTFQIPMAQNQEGDEIDATAPIIKVIQRLNKNEYRG